MNSLYIKTSYKASRIFTESYSTSFSLSSRFFHKKIRHDIYAIYGLVRIADEIVDTYRGDDTENQLNNFEKQTYHAMKYKYSTNPIIHAFAATTNKYKIPKNIIAPFFKSMRMDLPTYKYNSTDYREYIHGSAEVIGLMCLYVFVNGDVKTYDDLKPGAISLGSAYQKVNFLRDMASDYRDLGRVYFPGISFDNFSESDIVKITAEIKAEFDHADNFIKSLPKSSRTGVAISFSYYNELLRLIEKSSVETIRSQRIRVSNFKKLKLIGSTLTRQVFHG